MRAFDAEVRSSPNEELRAGVFCSGGDDGGAFGSVERYGIGVVMSV
jgi:hypothetical protein